MKEVKKYKAIIIGAGQGGIPLATTLAQAGWKVALVERAYVGGSCINTGCTPTKTMIASARVAHQARTAADYGVKTGQVSVDMLAVRNRKREMVKSFRQSTLERIKNTEVDLIRGEASFTGPKSITVSSDEGKNSEFSADMIFIDTGARPRIPDLPGLDEIPYLDSTTIMELDKIPDHLLILGGGYVGVEFGQMFRRFGSQVTIIERGSQLLSHEDSDVAEEIHHIFEQDGIEVLLDSQATNISSNGPGLLQLVVEQGQSKESLTLKGSHLLVATGRTPNIEALNLPATGIETDEGGHIITNERLQTAVEGLYALGDVKGGPAFTHISYDDFRILCTNLLEQGNASIEKRLIPFTVFTDPQLGRVGITEKQALAQDTPFEIFKIPMEYVSRSLEIGHSRGFMKALVNPETERILGCAILGVQGGEIMAQIEIAMLADLPYTVLRDGVFTHPTLAEGMNTLFSD